MTERGPVTIRTIENGEVERFARAFRATFAGEPSEHDLVRLRAILEPERAFAGVDADDEVVATAASFSFELAIPDRPGLPCAGISGVSVRADHRRRGLLTRLLAALHDQARERGEPIAALWASEAPIYGRFGYGPAIPTREFEIRRAHAAFTVPADPGLVRLVDTSTARREFPPIRDAARAERPGLLGRSSGWWDHLLDDDPPDSRDGAGPRRHALIPERAYAVYRVRGSWDDGVPNGQVFAHEVVATDAEAAAAMWRFLIDTDLTDRTVTGARPVDDPLNALVLDTARMRVVDGWPLYLRVLDVAGTLRGRSYRADGDVVIEVRDADLPANAGRWHLEVDGGTVGCDRTDRAADLSMDTRELATIVLGGVRTTQLIGAGRIEQHRPGVGAALDRLLATDLAPWHDFMF
jgi:predicted acetyltransferase